MLELNWVRTSLTPDFSVVARLIPANVWLSSERLSIAASNLLCAVEAKSSSKAARPANTVWTWLSAPTRTPPPVDWIDALSMMSVEVLSRTMPTPIASDPDRFPRLAADASATEVIWLLPTEVTLISPAASIEAEPPTSRLALFSVTEIAATNAPPAEFAWVKIVDCVVALDASDTAPPVDWIELVPLSTRSERDDVTATPMLSGNKLPSWVQPLFDISVWMVEALVTAISFAATIDTPVKFTAATALRLSVLTTTPPEIPGVPCNATALIVTLSAVLSPMMELLSAVMIAETSLL